MSPRRRSGPDKRGGLNGATQHLLEVYLQQFQKPKSFASIDSNATPTCLGLMEYNLTDRFSRRSTVGSTDLMVLLTQRSRTRCRACRSSCSSDLIGTKRILGRCTATAMASASRKSLLLVCT